MSKKVIIPTLTLVTLLAVGMFGAQVVKADDFDTSSMPVVQRLSEAFGLDESEVEAVFQAVRDEKRDEMQQRQQDRLEQAVADGVITEEQKQAMLDRHQEMEQERQQNREEMQSWYEKQGIDPEVLHEYMGFGPQGPGVRGGMMNRAN